MNFIGFYKLLLVFCLSLQMIGLPLLMRYSAVHENQSFMKSDETWILGFSNKMECPSALSVELSEDFTQTIPELLDPFLETIQTDNANTQCYKCIRNSSLDSWHQNESKKSIEFKDLIYAVFQGRGLRKSF